MIHIARSRSVYRVFFAETIPPGNVAWRAPLLEHLTSVAITASARRILARTETCIYVARALVLRPPHDHHPSLGVRSDGILQLIPCMFLCMSNMEI